MIQAIRNALLLALLATAGCGTLPNGKPFAVLPITSTHGHVESDIGLAPFVAELLMPGHAAAVVNGPGISNTYDVRATDRTRTVRTGRYRCPTIFERDCYEVRAPRRTQRVEWRFQAIPKYTKPRR